jgi:hypothetical protein
MGEQCQSFLVVDDHNDYISGDYTAQHIGE